MSEDEKRSEDLRGVLRTLFDGQRLAVLATHSEGQPYCSLVAFVPSDDLRDLVFATTRATRKFANMQGDERVALLVDSRSNCDEDFHRAVAATAGPCLPLAQPPRYCGLRSRETPPALYRIELPPPGPTAWPRLM